MAGSPNPLWSDAGAGWPPAGGAPTPDSILGRFIHDVLDPNLDFHPEATIQEWFKRGQQLLAAGAITNALSTPKGKKGIPRDHRLLASLITVSASVAFTADEQDVPLPDDCYLMLDAIVYPGLADQAVAVEIPWEWDFRARNRRQYMPTDERPLVAVRGGTKNVRFYIAGGILNTIEYAFRYLRIPRGVFVDTDDADKVKSDFPDPFNTGPLSYAVGRWKAARETDPTPELQEFAAALQATLPAPEKDEAAS